MGPWLQDLRFAGRMFLRAPLALSVIILTLALGIGATTAIFSVVNAVLLRPLPYEDPENLAVILAARPAEGIELEAVAYLNYLDLKEQNSSFSGFEAVSDPRRFTLTGLDQPEPVFGEFVTSGYFQLLGIEATHGRVFLPQEGAHPGREPVAVISHSLWQRRFGSDPQVVGRTLRVNEVPFTVTGVLPPVYQGIMWDPVDVWVPITMVSVLLGPQFLEERYWNWHVVVGRLQPGISLEQAHLELNTIAEGLEAQHPKINENRRTFVSTLPEFYFQTVGNKLLLLLLFSGSLLLICCLNVASIMTSHLTQRRQEMAVRGALGAGPWRLARLLAIQSTMVTLIGGGLGLVLTYFFTERLMNLSDIRPATFVNVYVDRWVLGACSLLCVATGLIFGVVPALLSRRAGYEEVLKEGYRGTTAGRATRHLRGAFVVVQIAVALCLLFGGGLVGQSFRRLSHGDPGFQADGLMTMGLDLPAGRYENPESILNFAHRLLDETRALPGVESASLNGPRLPPFADRVAEITAEDVKDFATFRVFRQAVFPGYFDTMGIPLLRGRDFTLHDQGAASQSAAAEASPPVAIISRPIAEHLWPGDNPGATALGRRLKVPVLPNADWIEIVGVVPKVKNRGLNSDRGGDMDLYFPMLQAPESSLRLVVRAQGDPASLAPALRQVVARLDPDLPVSSLDTMRDRIALRVADEYFTTILTSLLSATALFLAVVGVYGVMGSTIGQRRYEFGIRLSLGANRGAVLGLALRQAGVWLALGIGIGLVLIPFETWAVTRQLYGVDAMDPFTLLVLLPATVLTLAVTSLLAAFVPARRASKVDPMEVLRQE